MPEDALTEQRFELVLAELLQAEERGERPDPSDLLRRFPELETQLCTFLRNRARFDRLAPRLAPTVKAGAAPSGPEAEVPRRFGDYAVLEAVGRGGRGIVYRVSDPELNRPLAVKVLRPELRDDADAVRRFREEAQVMGQLQHPGIVPVHSLGRLPDGRPYFAMKLVQGRTLADLLAARPAPADDRPRFLAIFQQVCQAVAYAHSRGVIHRDLKPANVMVGAFAEVQVMDWGLAKVLGEPASRGRRPPEDVADGAADTVSTVRSGATGVSSADGLVVGTFAYMSPEQALGRIEELDARADVFGLGAVLCELLTGAPPYDGAPWWRLHHRAASADLADAFARLDACGADADLIALARDCLAPERERRPPDAGAVATRLATYLTAVEERLRRAEVEKAAAQARAEEARTTARAERRARRLTLGLAAAVLAIAASLTVGGLWLQGQQAEEARRAAALRQHVAVGLAQAVRLRQGAQFQESRELLEQLQQRLEPDGAADLREQVEKALADTALAKRLDSARLRVLTLVRGGGFDSAAAEKEYAAAFQEAGLGKPDDDAATVAARVRASAVRAELLAALDDWAGMTRDQSRQEWLLAVGRAADPDPGRVRLRRPELWRDGAALTKLATEARTAELSPQLVVALGKALLEAGEDPIPLLRRAQAHHPEDFFLNLALAVQLQLAKQPGQAIGYYRAALALRRVAGVHSNLGNALYENGDRNEALGHYREALGLDPTDAAAHSNLGQVLQRDGKLDEAIRHYREAVRLDPLSVTARYNLGQALSKAGLVDEAIRHQQQVLRRIEAEGQEAARRSGPGRPVRRPSYIWAHAKERQAATHMSLGLALYKKGNLDEAIHHCQDGVRIDPENAKSHNSLGVVLDARGRRGEAIGQYREALRIDPGYAGAHCNLATTLRESGKLDKAIEHYQEALCIDPGYATAHSGLGLALMDKGRLEEAISHCKQAVQIAPNDAQMHYNLGVTLYARGRFDEAIAAYRQAIVLKPQYAQAYTNLGGSLYQKGWVPEAIVSLQKAIQIDRSEAMAHHNLGIARRHQGRDAEAVGHFEDAIRINTKYTDAYGALGQSLLAVGRFAEAQAATERWSELLPRDDRRQATAALQLRMCKQMLTLQSHLPEILSGKAKPAGPGHAFDFAWLCRATNHPAHAARFYAEAFAAEPKPTDGRRPTLRQDAACCAVQAAAGLMADDKERARLLRQGLEWLRADLARWQARAAKGDADSRALVLRVLSGWQNDPRLAGVRDPAEQAALPGPERQDWQAFWAEVEALHQRLREAG
jgi:serine/threonine-protein kinase